MPSINLTTTANAAAQFIGVIDSGGSLTNQQLTDALAIANDLIDNWSQDRLMAQAAQSFPGNLSSGVGSYTVGPAQTFNLPVRPSAIESAAIRITNGPTMPVKVCNAVEWANIPDRDSTSYLVRYLFYVRTYPNAGILLSPVPLGGVIEFFYWAAHAQFADLTTTITMEPGFSRVLKLGLALELAPQYPGCKIPETLPSDFAEAKATFRQLNASVLGPEPPGGLVGPVAGPPMILSPSGSPGSSAIGVQGAK